MTVRVEVSEASRLEAIIDSNGSESVVTLIPQDLDDKYELMTHWISSDSAINLEELR